MLGLGVSGVGVPIVGAGVSLAFSVGVATGGVPSSGGVILGEGVEGGEASRRQREAPWLRVPTHIPFGAWANAVISFDGKPPPVDSTSIRDQDPSWKNFTPQAAGMIPRPLRCTPTQMRWSASTSRAPT